VGIGLSAFFKSNLTFRNINFIKHLDKLSGTLQCLKVARCSASRWHVAAPQGGTLQCLKVAKEAEEYAHKHPNLSKINSYTRKKRIPGIIGL
jgi:hypothetical protein